MESTNRQKRGICLTDEIYEKCTSKENQRLAGVDSINSFVEKAIRHYVGFLHSESDAAFLSSTFGEYLTGSLNLLQRATTQAFLRNAVMTDMLVHLIAPLRKVDSADALNTLYLHCLKEVLKANGMIDIFHVPKADRGISGNEHWQEDSL